MFRLFWLMLLLLSTFAESSWAAQGDWVESGPLKIRLISPLDTVDDRQRIPLALEMKIEKGWKTYWRVPGAAGSPPKLTINSAGLLPEVDWQWPSPDTYILLGMQSYGYEDYVVIPFNVTRTAEPYSAIIEAKATVYVCNDICLPLTFDLSIPLRKSSTVSTDWETSRLYNEYLSQVPKATYIGTVGAGIEAGQLFVSIQLPQLGLNPQAFIENLDVYEWPKPTVVVTGQTANMWWLGNERRKLTDIPETLAITYKDSLQAFSTIVPFSINSIPQVPYVASEPVELDVNLYLIVFIAFLGGVILNVMPCVLPVLSIKVMSWIEWQERQRQRVRSHSVATAAGIVTFFWLIAAMLTILKLGGDYVGWGIQFQNSWFLMFLIVVMAVFLANLLGLFEFRLPDRLQMKVTGVGEGKDGLVKSYLQGGTATLMATPCSAPFLGTAVTFAFTQSITGLWLVFTSIALGLALPYWIILAWPGGVNKLPRPGRWMVTVKKILALGLVGTLVWLLYVLNDHVNALGIMVIAGSIVVWLVGLRWLSQVKVYASVFLVFTLILVNQTAAFSVDEKSDPHKTLWEPYSYSSMAKHIEEGHTLLVDVTAQWCLTCKFNETTVLETEQTMKFFGDNHVVLLRADWTQPNTEIEALLSRYGRSAIPFNLVIGPNSPNGILLPEILTFNAVKSAVMNSK